LEQAVSLGTHALGFNFFPGSPRFLAPRQAKKLLDAVPPLVEAVGVVVGITPEEASKLWELHPGLTAIQWHGEPSNSFSLSKRWIRAWSVGSPKDLAELSQFLQSPNLKGFQPKGLLLDAKVKGMHGGTGQTLPWEILEGWESPHPWLLAGGLGPENVGLALETVHPFGVDVASGVESSPGIKDPGKLKAFFEAIQKADETGPKKS